MNSASKIVVGSLVAFFVIVLWRGFAPEGRTYGQISISSPEVFTRERLVNDRYDQDGWLKKELSKDSSCRAAGTARDARIATVAISATLPAAHPPEALIQSAAVPANLDAPAATANESVPNPSDWDCFEDAIDYRDQLRDLRIENQLDDRHDLNGASLFRLKFDIAVVPGQNTTALAMVHIAVGPGDQRLRSADEGLNTCKSDCVRTNRTSSTVDVAAWEPIYHDWIESVARRLNHTQREQLQRYFDKRFTESDYLALIRYLAGRHQVRQVDQVSGCGILRRSSEEIHVLPLGPPDHDKFRDCMLGILKETVSPVAYVGAYSDSHDLDPTHLPAPRRTTFRQQLTEQYAEAGLNSDLAAYFASKSVLLVLGIDVPPLFNTVYATKVPTNLLQGVGVGGPESSSSALFARLLKLSYIVPIGGQLAEEQRNADSFEVIPVDQKIVAIDKSIVTPDRFNSLIGELAPRGKPPTANNEGHASQASLLLSSHTYEDFTSPQIPPALPQTKSTLFASRSDISNAQIGLGSAADDRTDYPLSPNDFVPTDEPGVFKAVAHTGLYNFAQTLAGHSKAFAYAVTPQEHGVVLHTIQHGSQELSATLSGDQAAKGNAASARSSSIDQLKSRASIVGFGENGTRSSGQDRAVGEAMFSWIVNPQDVDSLTGTRIYRQSLRKYTVSAEISVPSWWRSLAISTTTAWRLLDGKEILQTNHSDTIEIPSDFEAFEETLLGSQGPELDDFAQDPIRLRANDGPKSIIIPGRRLWRSTQVTLGTEQAVAISVLPNMKGIVASFGPLPDMSAPNEARAWCTQHPGVADLEIERSVRVWTSQGAVTLPRPATIYILQRCSQIIKRTG